MNKTKLGIGLVCLVLSINVFAVEAKEQGTTVSYVQDWDSGTCIAIMKNDKWKKAKVDVVECSNEVLEKISEEKKKQK